MARGMAAKPTNGPHSTMREGLTHNVTPSPATLAPAAVAYQNLLRAAYGRLQELEAQVNKGPPARDARHPRRHYPAGTSTLKS